MEKYLKMFLAVAIVLMSVSCGGDDPKPTPQPEPEPTPVPTPDPIDPTALYNGIKLPSQWPPQRNYASEIRTGMTPFYLADKPSVLRINVGRQLFVDNFLIASTTLKRTFHYPEYHSANPVLVPDQYGGKNEASTIFVT